MNKIEFYRVNDPYGCFSNFSPHPITIDGKEWKTSEHYFQAMKFLDPKLQQRACDIKSPMDVALFGRDRSLPLRPDWDEVKDDIMRRAVLEKVIQNKFVFDQLLSTQNLEIIEHTKNDAYWADNGDGTGKNMLGIILIETRDIIHRNLRKIKILNGDITQSKAEAIVNAANKSLTGGGGVDGAIHRAAGPKLKLYCAKYKGCKTGEARISAGFNLPAKYVIHTVGPVWSDGDKNEDAKLAKAYKNSMNLAKEVGITWIAFPNISTGAYKFPFDRATAIQQYALATSLINNSKMDRVEIVCFSHSDFDKVSRIYRIQ